MGKMKELAYTVERLNALFQYLELLCEVNGRFVVDGKILRTCEEIEKELGIDDVKQVDVNVHGKIVKSENELAREIANKIFEQDRIRKLKQSLYEAE